MCMISFMKKWLLAWFLNYFKANLSYSQFDFIRETIPLLGYISMALQQKHHTPSKQQTKPE